MEMEDDSVPSVGNTEEVPHETSHEFCDPLIEEGIHIHNNHSHHNHNTPVDPHSPNVKYLFCKYCPYKTRFVGNLTKHVRTHTGEKPFSCRHCGKRFASRSNLNYHEATHTGNKRFQCFISGCQFKTQLRDSLNSHMRKIHGVLMQQNSNNPPGYPNATNMDPLHSPSVAAGPPGLPILQPINSMSNLPPIQDILTCPPASAGLSLHSNLPPSMTSPVDIKPSVAELAQYMIALHEGTTPNLAGKHDGRPQPPTPFSTTGEYNAVKQQQSVNSVTEDGCFNTSPVTVETDTESNQDSPRVGAPPDLNAIKPWGDPMAIQCSLPSIMPRLSASHTLTSTINNLACGVVGNMSGVPLPAPQTLKAPRSVSTDLVAAAMTEPAKSSALSTELLKIFQNLGLDTSAILELLAAQGRLHICRSCNIVFPEYSTFVLHRGCHGNEGPFQCHFCQRRFPEKFGFLTHFMQCPNK